MTHEAAGHSRRLNIDGEDDPKYECNLKLYKAAAQGDWATAKSIFDKNPDMLIEKIDGWQNTVLHVAVSSRRNMLFVQNLVNLMVQLDKPLGPKRDNDSTPLHCAAQAGNTQIARLLVEADQRQRLVTLLDNNNLLPIHMGAFFHHKETTKYLLEETLRHNSSWLAGASGLAFLISLIMDGFYDLAIQVLQVNPRLSVELPERGKKPEVKKTALLALAEQPQAFQSVWERMYTNKSDSPKEKDVENKKSSSIWKRLPPFQLFNYVRDEKLRLKNVDKILKILVDNASTSKQAAEILGPASRKAAECGNLKLVEKVIEAYPPIVCEVDSEKRNIFDIAVINRQEKVFNIIYQLGSWKYFTMGFDANLCTMWHHAAAFHPTVKINQIPGAALQMQRELQWYNEVKDIVQPSYKLLRNNEDKTPEMVFTESHRELVKEGGEWMKNTANSYTIVAALVVTITFAAAFTAPGGIHDDTGVPVFLNYPSFMIFAIADALALFSSTTSLLMFLGILTSRYSQKDFLKTLPMKLAIGQITLFFSIGWMLAAFTASVHVMLSQRVSWIAVPIGLLACLPVLLFASLQFPLLVELVYSTFGPTVFRKQSAKKLP